MNKGTINNARGYKPRSKAWLIFLPLHLQQIKFDDMPSAWNAISRVRVSYLDVKNQSRKLPVNFQGFSNKKRGTCDVLNDRKQQGRNK